MCCTDSPWQLLSAVFKDGDFDLKSVKGERQQQEASRSIKASDVQTVPPAQRVWAGRNRRETPGFRPGEACQAARFNSPITSGKQASPHTSGETFLPLSERSCAKDSTDARKNHSRRCQARKVSSAGKHFSPITGHTLVYVTLKAGVCDGHWWLQLESACSQKSLNMRRIRAGGRESRASGRGRRPGGAFSRT